MPKLKQLYFLCFSSNVTYACSCLWISVSAAQSDITINTVGGGGMANKGPWRDKVTFTVSLHKVEKSRSRWLTLIIRLIWRGGWASTELWHLFYNDRNQIQTLNQRDKRIRLQGCWKKQFTLYLGNQLTHMSGIATTSPVTDSYLIFKITCEYWSNFLPKIKSPKGEGSWSDQLTNCACCRSDPLFSFFKRC